MPDMNENDVPEEQKIENKNEKSKNKKRKRKAKLLDPIDHIDDVPASHFSTDTTMMTIKRIMRMHKEHHIKFPKYQRGDVWSKEDQSELIESIIRGIPIPPIYVDRKNNGQEWEILDGRQRETALSMFFIYNDVKINSNLPKGYESLKGYTFKEIKEANPNFAAALESISIPVTYMDDAPDDLKKDFFQKLNKTGRVLTPGELAHSTLDPAQSFIQDIIKAPFYELNVNKNKRYSEYVLATQLVHFIDACRLRNGDFSYNSKIGGSWTKKVCLNQKKVQTELDAWALQYVDDEDYINSFVTELNDVLSLFETVFDGIELNKKDPKFMYNLLIAILILSDPIDSDYMNVDELKNNIKHLLNMWNKRYSSEVRAKLRDNPASLTDEESRMINECNSIEKRSKTCISQMMENLRIDAYNFEGE